MNKPVRRPRVGIDLHVVDGIFQGSRTHCLELFSRVIEHSPGLQFVGFLEKPEALRDVSAAFSQSNVELVRMPHADPASRLLRQLPFLAWKHRIDLLHTQYISPPLSPCESVVSIHDVLYESHPEFFGRFFRVRSRLLVRHSARRSAHVFTGSEFSRAEIIHRYDLRPENVTNISNGSDTNRFFPGEEGREEVEALGIIPGKYLLTVGRLEPRKNHIGLLKAFAILKSPRPKLVIIGQRHFGYSEIEGLIDKLSLEEDVVIFDKIADSLLPALYRHALVFVYPTWAEGFGMPVLEAMASGVPVVTSGNTSLPEVAGDTAIFIDPSEAKSISDALERLIADERLRKDMGVRGRLRAYDFNWMESARLVRDRYLQYFQIPPVSPT